MDPDSFKFMFPNYEYLIQNTLYLKDILQTELLTKALLANIADSNLTCQEFFTDAFADFAELCSQK